MKVIIVGGVAAGAGAAARLRRLDENAEIILLERGSYISFANCGLPYQLGGVIPERDSLLVTPEPKFRSWFNVDIRTNQEAIALERDAKQLRIRRADGTEYTERYDRLLLATGSSPLVPPLPGIDSARILRFWTIPDLDRTVAQLAGGATRATVVGGGFIGLEVAENLRRHKLEVTVVELAEQVLPTVDREMSSAAAAELVRLGVTLELGQKVTGFEENCDGVETILEDRRRVKSDFVVLCIGVTPNSQLARSAGLELGRRGHIRVNEQLQTSDPAIYAAGDVIEFTDPLLGGVNAIALAGPANKQARIAADNLAGRNSRYRGTYGASIIQVGTLTVASVGATEARLRTLGREYRKIYAHPSSSAGYYPGAAMIDAKLLFAPDGKLYGAQLSGTRGVDKRIDVIAAAMESGRTAAELAELELSYAPPYNSAKDPVNLLGMIAQNLLDGDTVTAYADDLPPDALLIDVRQPEEFELSAIPGAVNLPLPELRKRLGELDRNREVITYCRVGQRGYLAERILRQHGFNVRNLSGGYLTWKQFHPIPPPTAKAAPTPAAPVPASTAPANRRDLDVRALACPGPVVRLKNEVNRLAPGEAIHLLAPLSFESDLLAWSQATGHPVGELTRHDDFIEATVRTAAPRPITAPAATPTRHGCAIVLFSNDLDKAMAALIIACGMAASGAKVGIFFTFWGLSVLRKDPAPPVKKGALARLFGWMLPRGAGRLSLSKLNMGGAGTMMMKQIMADQNVTSLPELLRQARELGVRFVACEMAMNVMGIHREELIEVDDVAGVASFVAMAKESNNTLFI